MWPFKRQKPGLKNRQPRVRLLPEEEVYFEHMAHKFRVSNISESGLALVGAGLGAGQKIAGSLVLAKETLSLELEVMRSGSGSIGLRILSGEKALRGALRRMFSDELHAMDMSAVAAERLEEESEGNPHWYYAPGNYELYAVEKDGRILKGHISWKDHIFAITAGGLKSGTLHAEDREAPAHAKSALVSWHSAMNAEDQRKALRIIKNVHGLEEHFKDTLVKAFGG